MCNSSNLSFIVNLLIFSNTYSLRQHTFSFLSFFGYTVLHLHHLQFHDVERPLSIIPALRILHIRSEEGRLRLFRNSGRSEGDAGRVEEGFRRVV